MASDEAIKLANNFSLFPELIFRESGLDTSTKDLMALLKRRTCTVFELFSTMQRCRDFGLKLELELEAFEYWMENNKELVDKWDGGDKTVLLFGNIDHAREGSEKIKMLLDGVMQIFEEVKRVPLKF